MASSQATVDYICEQGAAAGAVSARKMFGEYALYVGGTLVALICDDQLFLKVTETGRLRLARETGADAPAQGSPYPGAKPCFLIAGDLWDDAAFLSGLLRETAAALPAPAPKKPRAVMKTGKATTQRR